MQSCGSKLVFHSKRSEKLSDSFTVENTALCEFSNYPSEGKSVSRETVTTTL